jgi:hypothetical protein
VLGWRLAWVGDSLGKHVIKNTMKCCEASYKIFIIP